MKVHKKVPTRLFWSMATLCSLSDEAKANAPPGEELAYFANTLGLRKEEAAHLDRVVRNFREGGDSRQLKASALRVVWESGPFSKHRLSEPSLARPPGFAFSRFIGSFLPRRLREAVEAQHADALSYYLELLAEKNEWGARKVAVMMHVWILWSVAASAIPLMLGMFKGAAGTSKE